MERVRENAHWLSFFIPNSYVLLYVLDTSSYGFGIGTVPVTLLNPRCRGTESSLAECVYAISQNVCSRSQHGIVGIQCIRGKKTVMSHTWKL